MVNLQFTGHCETILVPEKFIAIAYGNGLETANFPLKGALKSIRLCLVSETGADNSTHGGKV